MNRKLLVAVASFGTLVGLVPFVLAGVSLEEFGAMGPELVAQTTPATQVGANGGACISSQTVNTLKQCPANAAKLKTGARAAPVTHLIETKRNKAEAKRGQTRPGVILDDNDRRGRGDIQIRAKALLEREISTLERLAGRARAGDARGGEYLLRLAEAYFEFQQLYTNEARKLDEALFQAEQSKNRSKVDEVRRAQRGHDESANKYREQAIRTYARLIRDYPTFPRKDEVLFSLAFGLEEMHRVEDARKVYLELIKGHSQSRFVPYAWLSFAEFYFNEGDMAAAQRFYAKVVETEPTRNPVYGFALYKMAWAFYNIDDYRGALTQFAKVIEFADANPDAKDAANLSRQSRRELVLPFSRVGRPEQALEFFKRYAKDRDQEYDMLENLGELYFDTGQWPETITVYHKLMSEKPNSDKVCYWQTRVSNAVISSKTKAEQKREAQRLTDIMTQFVGSHQSNANAVKLCKQGTATVLIELATAWHRETVGTEEQPGTNDQNTMILAAEIYQMLSQKIPDMDTLEYPDIRKEDWPTLYRVKYFAAELLYQQKRWMECAREFGDVVELNPQGEFLADAADGEVICYNNLYQEQYSSSERETRNDRNRSKNTKGRRGSKNQAAEPAENKYAPRDYTPVEAGMLNAFARYMCYIDDSEKLPTIKYRRARIYYETNHFEEAAVLFKDIALNHKESDLGEFAANLYLDALNVMGSDLGRSACLGDLQSAIDPLWNGYCRTEAEQNTHSDLCGTLKTLRCEVKQKRAEDASKNGRHAESAQLYREATRLCFDNAEKVPELIHNAAIEYERAKLIGKAVQVRKKLAELYPQHPLGKRAVYDIAGNYQALTYYAKAAEHFEEFARKFPTQKAKMCTAADVGIDRALCCTQENVNEGTCPIAHVALEQATFFRLGTGDEEKAIEDARNFERQYRREMPRKAAEVIFSLGSIYERQKQWIKVIEHYQDFLGDYKTSALPHESIRANVQIGRGLWETDRKDRAEKYFKDAVALWQRNAAQTIDRLQGASDEQRRKYLAEAKIATAEALFYIAEYKFFAFRDIRFPAITGRRNAAAVQEWANTDFRQWMEKKRAALLAAQTAYEQIATLEVPQWQISGAARVGEMFRVFMDQIDDSPMPEEFERDPELAGIYDDALNAAMAPLRVQSTEKFEYCLITATRLRWFNDFSRQCEQELSRLDPAKYPPAAELRGQPTYQRLQSPTATASTLQSSEEEATPARPTGGTPQ